MTCGTEILVVCVLQGVFKQSAVTSFYVAVIGTDGRLVLVAKVLLHEHLTLPRVGRLLLQLRPILADHHRDRLRLGNVHFEVDVLEALRAALGRPVRRQMTLERLVQEAALLPLAVLLREGAQLAVTAVAIHQVVVDAGQTLALVGVWQAVDLELVHALSGHAHHEDDVVALALL